LNRRTAFQILTQTTRRAMKAEYFASTRFAQMVSAKAIAFVQTALRIALHVTIPIHHPNADTASTDTHFQIHPRSEKSAMTMTLVR